MLAAVAFVQWLVHVDVAADVALLIALYTVAAHESARAGRSSPRRSSSSGAVLAAASDGGFREFVGLSALSVAAGVLGTSVRHRRALLASLEDRAARLELERDQQGLIAAAAERARIAREMHDIVAHNLTVMVALADGAVFAAERTPEKAIVCDGERVRDRTAGARPRCGGCSACCATTRRSTLVPQPGVPQIDQLVEQVRAAGLPVTLEVAGDGRALSAGAQLTVFRLVQESLTNCLKHAGASARRAGAPALRPRWRRRRDHGQRVQPRRGPASPAGAASKACASAPRCTPAPSRPGPRADGGWRVHARLSLEPAADIA